MADEWLLRAKEDGASIVYATTDSNLMIDQGAGGHNATMTNGPSPARPVANSFNARGVDFDGINQYAAATSDADFNMTASWSIEWSMTSQLHAVADSTIIHHGNPTTNGYRIWMETADTSNVFLGWVLQRTPDTQVDQRTPNGTVVHGKNQHFIMSYASNAVTLYVDGAAVTPSADTSLDSAATAVSIGRRDSDNDRFFHGCLGPIMIYASVALTATQALDHYHLFSMPNPRNRFDITGKASNRAYATGFYP